ncbi:unnamed protein product [Rotaria sordida]|uniref:Uncharacterized protein n=1 Tax=Rotaria sordida TaxID=392033 RepID=A0A815TKD0_9BILA|nr:unnamed protein product [Rotaria sordida]CAF1656295.1 unnamed protein product [Rotaria sordida]
MSLNRLNSKTEIYKYFQNDIINNYKSDEVITRPYYIRNRNAFTSRNYLSSPAHGSTNIYTEDAHGNPTCNFDILDQIYDNYLANNFVPCVEFDLVLKSSEQQDYDLNGWKYPRKDYNK